MKTGRPKQRLPSSCWNSVTAAGQAQHLPQRRWDVTCGAGAGHPGDLWAEGSVASVRQESEMTGVGPHFPFSDSLGLFRGKALKLHRLSCFGYVREILGLGGVMHPRGAGSGSNEIHRAGANSATRPAPQIHILQSLSLPCPKFPCISAEARWV